MATVEVSSSDFRGKMGTFFDRADRGEQIVIRRRDKTSYTLTPVYEEDEELTPELMRVIDEGLENIRKGEGHVWTNLEDWRKRMGL